MHPDLTSEKLTTTPALNVTSPSHEALEALLIEQLDLSIQGGARTFLLTPTPKVCEKVFEALLKVKGSTLMVEPRLLEEACSELLALSPDQKGGPFIPPSQKKIITQLAKKMPLRQALALAPKVRAAILEKEPLDWDGIDHSFCSSHPPLWSERSLGFHLHLYGFSHLPLHLLSLLHSWAYAGGNLVFYRINYTQTLPNFRDFSKRERLMMAALSGWKNESLALEEFCTGIELASPKALSDGANFLWNWEEAPFPKKTLALIASENAVDEVGEVLASLAKIDSKAPHLLVTLSPGRYLPLLQAMAPSMGCVIFETLPLSYSPRVFYFLSLLELPNSSWSFESIAPFFSHFPSELILYFEDFLKAIGALGAVEKGVKEWLQKVLRDKNFAYQWAEASELLPLLDHFFKLFDCLSKKQEALCFPDEWGLFFENLSTLLPPQSEEDKEPFAIFKRELFSLLAAFAKEGNPTLCFDEFCLLAKKASESVFSKQYGTGAPWLKVTGLVLASGLLVEDQAVAILGMSDNALEKESGASFRLGELVAEGLCRAKKLILSHTLSEDTLPHPLFLRLEELSLNVQKASKYFLPAPPLMPLAGQVGLPKENLFQKIIDLFKDPLKLYMKASLSASSFYEKKPGPLSDLELPFGKARELLYQGLTLGERPTLLGEGGFFRAKEDKLLEDFEKWQESLQENNAFPWDGKKIALSPFCSAPCSRDGEEVFPVFDFQGAQIFGHFSFWSEKGRLCLKQDLGAAQAEMVVMAALKARQEKTPDLSLFLQNGKRLNFSPLIDLENLFSEILDLIKICESSPHILPTQKEAKGAALFIDAEPLLEIEALGKKLWVEG